MSTAAAAAAPSCPDCGVHRNNRSMSTAEVAAAPSCPDCGGPPTAEYLSVVSKVCSEVQARFGVGPKLLGMFITHLAVESGSVAEFDAKLRANGADFPDDFVRALIGIIHGTFPPSSASAARQ